MSLKWKILLGILGFFGAVFVCCGCAFAYLYATIHIPEPESIALSETTTVYYADGTTELGTFAQQNRSIIDCSVLPDYVGQAIVSSEDRTFYSNNGIDLKGILRALIKNVTTGSRQGGSTITQQYAERYYLGDTTTYLGKLKEAILAIKIANTQSKEEVLCNYMNTIYFGRGAYGIQAASQAYYGIDAKDMTLSQAALLAGITPAPSAWDPAVNSEQAQARFDRVIRIMQEDGYITSKDVSEAHMPETIETTIQNTYSGTNGYLLTMVRSELVNAGAFSEEELDTGGYKIITTIDQAKQEAMFTTASPSQYGSGIVPESVEVGAISVNVSDGSIISLYAGDDYITEPYNNVTQALYEPGSTMKPFALLGAIQNGVSLNTLFNGNSPQTYNGISTPVANYANRNYGNINLYDATAYSVNTVYMEIQQKLGTHGVADIAVQAGMDADLVTGNNPFTVLGNDGVHVLDIAQGYQTIANEGKKITLHIVSSVTDTEGNDLYHAATEATTVFDAQVTQLVREAMKATVQYGTATEVRTLGREVAGKSGTANDGTAESFVGFTPSTLSVFAIWNPDENGNPQVVPTINGVADGVGWPAHLYTLYMAQAIQGTAAEKFSAVIDTGKVGGNDGTWGLGAASSKTDDDDTSEEEGQDETSDDANTTGNGSTSQDQDSSSTSGGSGTGPNGDGSNGGESSGSDPSGSAGGEANAGSGDGASSGGADAGGGSSDNQS